MRHPSQAGRDLGQRWFPWKNVDPDEETCPAFGVVRIASVLVDGTQQFVFTGGNYNGVADDIDGVEWKHGFNGVQPVEFGQRGLLTFDLPTWVKVENDVDVGNFVTMPDSAGRNWTLVNRVISDGDAPQLGGFQVHHVRAITDPDQATLYTIGFVGGLVTYLHGTRAEVYA